MSPLPSSCSAPVASRIGRESTLDDTRNEIRAHKRRRRPDIDRGADVDTQACDARDPEEEMGLEAFRRLASEADTDTVGPPLAESHPL